MSLAAAEHASQLQREALDYWERKRAGRAMPARRDLDPTEIPRLLVHVVLAEIIPGQPVDFRFRLVGDAVRARARENIVGRRMSEIAHMREGMLRQHYTEVVETARPVARQVTYVGPDRLIGSAEHLLLPLGADGTSVDMVFGVVEFAVLSPVAKPQTGIR